MRRLFFILAALLSGVVSQGAITLTNVAPTNITATSAYLNVYVAGTGGANPSLVFFYDDYNYTTNTALWTYSNVYGEVSSIGTVSVQVTDLTPATRYYFRGFASDTTSSAWASPSSNWLTSATTPISVPSGTNHTLMINEDSKISGDTNFFTANKDAMTNALGSFVELEVDPIFTASVAAAITADDTQTWHEAAGYTSRVAAVEAATGVLNTAVGELQDATNALDVRVTATEAATGVLNTAVGELQDATNALDVRVTAVASYTQTVAETAGYTQTVADVATYTQRVADIEANTQKWNAAAAFTNDLIGATNDLATRSARMEAETQKWNAAAAFTNDLKSATNALDIRVSALESGAGGTYPVFLLPVGALEGSWTDFEIKASTNNWASTALYWWKSWTSQPLQNDSDAIALFTDPYAGADPRTLYRRTTDVSIATHLASEDSTVEVVIFQPSHNIEGGGTWMSPANTNLVWEWIRVDDGGYEMTPDGSNYWFHPILPEQWMAAPLGQWEWAEIHTAKLAAAYAETYVTWRTNTFDGTNGVYFVNPHNGSNYWILTP